MIIIYLAVVVTALYWVIRILGPEMAKPPIPKVPSKPKLALKTQAVFKIKESEPVLDHEPAKRIEKLESLLAEKNKNINLLLTDLKVSLIQIREFDKVRSLLEEEVHHLRQQNRVFRSELGLPAIQPAAQSQESSIA